MDNIFEKASRVALRFDLNGQISTEQLWKANLTALVDFEQQLTEVVESYGKSTRRTRQARTVAQETNELRLAIVTYIIDVREKEAEDAVNAAAIKEQRQKVLAEKLRRKEVALTTMSDEELDALLK